MFRVCRNRDRVEIRAGDIFEMWPYFNFRPMGTNSPRIRSKRPPTSALRRKQTPVASPRELRPPPFKLNICNLRQLPPGFMAESEVIRELTIGGLIRQHRETDYQGNFVRLERPE